MEIKLKPCPFCGGKSKLKHGFPSRQRGDMRQATVQCLECGCRTVTYRQAAYEAWENVDRQAVETWNNRVKAEAYELSNDPLTLDELREMDGEPVWISPVTDGGKISERWMIASGFWVEKGIYLFIPSSGMTQGYKESFYGKSWLAYRRKPKEV